MTSLCPVIQFTAAQLDSDRQPVKLIGEPRVVHRGPFHFHQEEPAVENAPYGYGVRPGLSLHDTLFV